MVPRLRRVVFAIHLWTGLTLGLLTIAIGLSGSLMVFRPEIDRILLPHPAAPVPRARWTSLEGMLARVRSRFPDERFLTVDLPRTEADPVEFWAKGSDLRVFADPGSGAILGSVNEERTVTGFLFALHTRLLAGETGHVVVGFAGLGLAILCLTGVFVWWPRKNQKLRDHLTVKRTGSAKRFNYDLHRTVGFYVCAPLAAVAVCGVGLVFPQPFGAAMERLTGSKLSEKPKGTSKSSAELSLDALLAKAERAMPEGDPTRIVLPARSGAPLVVRKRLPNERHPNGMSSVALDPSTGKVLKAERDLEASPAQRAMSLRYPIHTGAWGGTGTRVLHAALGLAPAVLGVTGLVMWRRRLVRRR